MVSKLTGEIKEAGTALPTEHYVREFEVITEKVRLGAETVARSGIENRAGCVKPYCSCTR